MLVSDVEQSTEPKPMSEPKAEEEENPQSRASRAERVEPWDVVLLLVVVFLARTSHQPASRTLHTCLQKSAGNSAGAECSAAAIKAELVRSSFCLAKRLQVFIVQPEDIARVLRARRYDSDPSLEVGHRYHSASTSLSAPHQPRGWEAEI